MDEGMKGGSDVRERKVCEVIVPYRLFQRAEDFINNNALQHLLPLHRGAVLTAHTQYS